jgi:hypothetical protein
VALLVYVEVYLEAILGQIPVPGPLGRPAFRFVPQGQLEGRTGAGACAIAAHTVQIWTACFRLSRQSRSGMNSCAK